jgi:hypothetical protein
MQKTVTREEFAHALSGKIESVQKGAPKVLLGYIIRDMMGFLYTTNTTMHLNKWRKLKAETELFWVIEEHLNPYNRSEIILYKTKEIAEEHLVELKNEP